MAEGNRGFGGRGGVPSRGVPRAGGRPRDGGPGFGRASKPPHKRMPPRSPLPRWPKPLEILYEDRELVAVDKPAGLPLIGARGEPGVVDVVRRQLRIRRQDRGPWTLHQVEPSATGVVLLARTPAARETVQKSRRFERHYLALVAGGPAAEDAPENGTISSEEPGKELGEVRSLVTHYQRLGHKDGVALLRLRPKTDARGQIDRHLRALKARPADKPGGASGLHLYEISLSHPATGSKMRIQSPAPAWMYERVGLEAPEDARRPEADTAPMRQGWDEVAEWYAGLVSSARNDLQTEVVWPGVQRLLGAIDGARVLDVACGEGSFAKELAAGGAHVVGVDASPKLIEFASTEAAERVKFLVADAAELHRLELGRFDAACCLLALMNIKAIDAVIRNVAMCLEDGGRFVGVVLHPAFRSPRRTSWMWEGRDAASNRQFRRVDAYLSEEAIPIVMNPGEVAEGGDAVTTTTYVRPLQRYVAAIAAAGLQIDAVEEWASRRESEPGPRAAEENRARREIPMFLAFRAIKPKDSEP